ncbi:peptidylprolyl isomerase [Piscirickettsia salmonis]|uniref:Peptidyl-prolyl cis-trans isomerase n=1 Tax=Piscirickettsia salmonis TaxID=1238 RepID=A0A9Q6LN65_PISSA|nr:FKBP-type peptidyl-prolyl cis-trans isomerase [Piscirickettsia salmonis]ALA23913.1 FKBP-type peptidyl-prolyl cis-trans isomerase [Piscirickettsia salmonis]APS44329.1 peptidylprolyl isomerase [Piscirickettsia salmonis]APS47690.1 peptidylprolyl isomerase [Piscirickettsia salmonis]APS50880.1 peptidylprolyl isomerase [Piscirickettsia salmonis]APS54083.1 peptidylprolyl isomerase [Piscirickettsia salmonis]
MKIIKEDSAVVFHLSLLLEDGSAADSTRVNGKPMCAIMNDGSLTLALQAHLLGLSIGDKKKFTLTPEESFGQPRQENIQRFDKTRFADDISLEAGSIIAFEQMGQGSLPGQVRGMEGDEVIIDFNHPLCGHNVTFDIEIVDIDPESN